MDARQTHTSWIILAVLYLLSPIRASAAECDPVVATFASIEGQVEMRAADGLAWHQAVLDQTLCPGGTVKLGANSRAAIILSNHTLVRLDAFTTLTITGQQDDESFWVELVQGITHFMSRVPRKLKINTPFVNAGVDGTEFLVRVDDSESFLSVFEGQVGLDNQAGMLSLVSGESAVTRKGEAPVMQVVVRPQDAVQWALYYPPIIDPFRPGSMLENAADGAVQESLNLFAQGDLLGALARLDKVPNGLRDGGFYTYRGSLLLYVGRVDEAEVDIKKALAQNLIDAGAISLSSVIALVRNDREEALRLASEAVELQPGMAAPHIAQSYAQQSLFDLESAFASVQKATEMEPENALAWARVAELELSRGFLRRAVDAAEKSVSLSPNLARTQWILGFAYLSQFKVKQAEPAFLTAIKLNDADPMARLGLGLLKIRRGKLDAGRRDIEIAAILNPADSILRSYLGKAYYEEKRDNLAATEYGLAKEKDPNDPTPWFYNAIRLQADNKPIAALDDLQESIRLNDNRAVFRSSLLLDKDEAARSANLARIYQNLGFQQLGLVEGYKSVNTDPSSDSAHRFLADSYAAVPRHEIARVSELLQSQLLQPLNTTPLQPQLAQSDLAIPAGAGPGNASFNEFNPMFTRNRIAFQVDAIFGSNNTWGNDMVISGLHNWASFSLGQFHYETDGYRPNNDLKHDINNVFVQFALPAGAGLQFEARSRESEFGDRVQRIDGSFSPDNRRTINNDSVRAGYRQKLSPSSSIIFSLAYDEEEDSSTLVLEPDIPNLPAPLRVESNTSTNQDGYTFEGQYILDKHNVGVILGAGQLSSDLELKGQEETTIGGFPTPGSPREFSEADRTQHNNAYAYANIKVIHKILVTLGASYDDLNSEAFTNRDELNPKLGLVATPNNKTTIRAAGFKVMRRTLFRSQTIEPTQVAGFNQFFDDFAGTVSTRYGLGLDYKFNKALYVGGEATGRDLEVPLFGEEVAQNELMNRAYIFWTPTRFISLGASYIFDKFYSDKEITGSPRMVRTQSIPIPVTYYHPTGFFTGIRPTYVDQDVELSGTQYAEDFWSVDLRLGYRMPKRLGIVSLVIKNLFDEQFLFQDRNFQTNEPVAPMYEPERTIFVNFTVSI